MLSLLLAVSALTNAPYAVRHTMLRPVETRIGVVEATVRPLHRGIAHAHMAHMEPIVNARAHRPELDNRSYLLVTSGLGHLRRTRARFTSANMQTFMVTLFKGGHGHANGWYVARPPIRCAWGAARCIAHRTEGGVPRARQEVPSGHEPRRSGCEGVSNAHRGAPSVLTRATAPAYAPY